MRIAGWAADFKAIWQSRELGDCLMFLSWVFLVHWLFNPPPPNYSLIAMAVAAGLMPMRGEMSGRERTIWAVILIFFALVEVRAIHKDNIDREGRSALADTALQNNFKNIGNDIRDNVYAVTGGNDFVTIEPASVLIGRNGVALLASVSGPDKEKLHTIREPHWRMNEGHPPYLLNLQDMKNILSGKNARGVTSGNLRDLAPGMSYPFMVLHPPIDKESYYNINIDALNGSTNEKLQIRYDKNNKVWDWKMAVTRGSAVLYESDWNLKQP